MLRYGVTCLAFSVWDDMLRPVGVALVAPQRLDAASQAGQAAVDGPALLQPHALVAGAIRPLRACMHASHLR